MSEKRKGRNEGARIETMKREGLTKFLSIPRNPIIIALPLPDRNYIKTTVEISIAVGVFILAIARLSRS